MCPSAVTRKRLGAACAMVVAASLANAASASPQFSFLDLGTLGGNKSEAYDINNSGQVVGASRTSAGLNHAFRTAANSPITLANDLGVLTGGTQSFGYSINSAGQVVGDGNTPSGDRAFRYSGGVMANLGTMGGDWSYSYGINASGQVAGAAAVNKFDTRAFIYSGGSMHSLGSLVNNRDSYARAINTAGQIVGYGGSTDFLDHAFLWTPNVANGTTGTLTDLGTLGGSTSYAWSINDNNVIVGGANTTGDLAFHAFKYVAGVYTDLGTLGGSYSEAFDINLGGDIVGSANDGGDAPRAFFYSAGTMYDLTSLVSASAPGWTLTSARAINDGGQIVGIGQNGSGETRGFVLSPIVVVEPTWKNDADGAWSASSNWVNGVPNAAGAVANFGSVITAPRTVTVDAPVTVGRISFNNNVSYSVAGTNAITVDATSGSGVIHVAAGSHSIAAPLHLQDNTSIDITPAAGALTLSGAVTAAPGVAITKQGAGTLAMNHLRVTSANVTGGTLKIAPNGGEGGMSAVQNLSITGGAKLDLTDNAIAISAGDVGSWNGSAYTGITGLVQSGRNGGTWDGPGLITSLTDAKSPSVLTTLAVATAAETGHAGGTFRGVSVSASDVIVMYTWGGDANLDGTLDSDDYFQIDSHVNLSGSAFGFHNGDFNYDGEIDGDDYFIIDTNIELGQSAAPFMTSGGVGGLAEVPEPASLALIPLGCAALSRRRRR